MRVTKILLLLLLVGSVSVIAQETALEKIKVAAVQFPVVGNSSPEEFLDKVEGYIQEASQEQAQLIVFPELFSLDVWPEETGFSDKKIVGQIAHNLTPMLFSSLANWSSKYEIAILGGSSPRVVKGKIYNTAPLFFPSGERVYQDKVFLTYWEEVVGFEKGSEIQMIQAPWGKTVILICYDAEFSCNSQLLVPYQPELLLVPSMTEDIHGFHRVRWTTQARVVEHCAYAIISGTVDKVTEDWLNYGQVAFLTPQDHGFSGVLKEGPLNQAAIVYAIVDLQKLREHRKNTKFYPARKQHRRSEKIEIREKSFTPGEE